jgi:phosphohistidine phosphatase
VVSGAWRELVLFRHGEAAPARGAGGDYARELTASGRQVVTRAAAQLAMEVARSASVTPARAMLLHSLAPRAAQTAALLVEALALPGLVVQALEPLYLAPPERIGNLLATHAADATWVAVVGHNPGLSEFGALLDLRCRDSALGTASYWRFLREPASGSGLAIDTTLVG